jgi:hypothetical protein
MDRKYNVSSKAQFTLFGNQVTNFTFFQELCKSPWHLGIAAKSVTTSLSSAVQSALRNTFRGNQSHITQHFGLDKFQTAKAKARWLLPTGFVCQAQVSYEKCVDPLRADAILE